jgi:3-isopropylmalate/(R)-2-methylmalate dehydratase small subunit
MDKFTTLTGVAAPLAIDNIDTDMIIPKQYLKTIKRTGLGAGLFAEMRYREDGSEHPDFVLNKPAYRKASIIVGGHNFGCGSSREHAPWALLDFGIRCVIATDFADIFYNNCFKNGILPVTLPDAQIDEIFDRVEETEGYQLTVDLKTQTVSDNAGLYYSFTVDPFRRECLLNGWDDIGLTLRIADRITDYEKSHHPAAPLYSPVDAAAAQTGK